MNFVNTCINNNTVANNTVKLPEFMISVLKLRLSWKNDYLFLIENERLDGTEPVYIFYILY